MGGGGNLLTSGEVLVQPHLSRLLEKEARGSDRMKGLELAWLVGVERVRRLHAFLSQGICSAESRRRKMKPITRY